MAESIHLLGLPKKHYLTDKHLEDVILGTLADEHVLTWEAATSKWKNKFVSKIRTLNLLLKEYDAANFAIRNLADAAWRGLLLSTLRTYGHVGILSAPDGYCPLVIEGGIHPDGNAIPFKAKSTTSGTGMKYVAFEVENLRAPSVDNKAVFSLVVQSTDWRASAFLFFAWLDPVVTASRTGHVEMWCANAGTLAPRLKIDGDQVTIPALAGTGNAYVYVDANGKLCRGSAYP